ncbi:MAG TPA: amino acid permease, partial [Solirubrobacteraceae bacterium]|nr:amino acid permease [Solirubrobacteraceae bacterium]
ITACTALGLSSIVTNLRVGPGGAYSIIAQSLGFATGGGVGIPLYLAQTLVVVLYVFGFREGWLFIFPGHPTLLVDLAVFVVLFVAALVSARLAFRVQYAILAMLVAAFASIALAAVQGSMTEPIQWFGEYPGAPREGDTDASFFGVFAVFFPAATGILAGVNMSGELRTPRRSIPMGMLSAIAVSLVVYLAVAYWLARSAPPDRLVRDYTAIVDLAAFAPAVLAGLLGATFSSALAALVGAPRVLQAIAEDRLVPGGRLLARRSASGEPRVAMLVTGAVIVAGLMMRDLNALAPVLTMFFLITYLTINVVVLVEQRLGLVSFRPYLKVPQAVPGVGAVGCLAGMFVVNWIASLVALVLVAAVSTVLAGRRLRTPTQDVRSALYAAIAEWSVRRASRLGSARKAWKPDLLVPFDPDEHLGAERALLWQLTRPNGSVKLLAVAEPDADVDAVRDALDDAAQALRDDGAFVTAALVEDEDWGRGIVAAMQALSAAYFAPRVLFVTVSPGGDRDGRLARIFEAARERGLGVALYCCHPDVDPSDDGPVNVWLERPHPSSEEFEDEIEYFDLAVLVAIQLANNREVPLNLVGMRGDEEADVLEAYLDRIRRRGRLPSDTRTCVLDHGPRDGDAPHAGLTLFSLTGEPDFPSLSEVSRACSTPCLFLRDSGEESAVI